MDCGCEDSPVEPGRGEPIEISCIPDPSPEEQPLPAGIPQGAKRGEGEACPGPDRADIQNEAACEGEVLCPGEDFDGFLSARDDMPVLYVY